MTTIDDLSAGDDVDSRCLKCKAVTNHTIIAVQDGQIVKVQCNTCRGRHNYRPVKPEVKKAVRRSSAKTKPRLGKEVKQAARFEDLLVGRDLTKALPYAMTAVFEPDDLIDHPTFGLGVVAKKISPVRIEVFFKDAQKVLVCASSL
ncbi:MAG: hypothetical protein OEY01_10405 [Desulfobulbaceae bacterium]|nr:hypothetical protein [Desulfobulbaceae bacterium]HIJ79361.1 hypothetical protein [Deltaproteobacteria bacterium]